DVHVTAEAIDGDHAAAGPDLRVQVLAGPVLAADGLPEIAVEVAGERVGPDPCRNVGGEIQPHVPAHRIDLPGRIRCHRAIQLDAPGDRAEIHLVHRTGSQQHGTGNRLHIGIPAQCGGLHVTGNGLRFEAARGAGKIDIAADAVHFDGSSAHAEVHASADAAGSDAAAVQSIDVHRC